MIPRNKTEKRILGLIINARSAATIQPDGPGCNPLPSGAKKESKTEIPVLDKSFFHACHAGFWDCSG
jgi:hypothetical protein